MKKLFATDKQEGSRSKWYRRFINLWPCVWCTGSSITFVAHDFTELHVALPLNLRTRNRVGTVFGGSIYSSVDPHFMLMLMQILGKDYVVWDKGASMKFVKPINKTVKCRFLLDAPLIEHIKTQTLHKGEYVFELPLHFEDEAGKVYAVFNKTMYTATKEFYKKKLAQKEGR